MLIVFDNINIVLSFTAFLIFLLGFFIFFNGPRKKINLSYSAICVAVLAWILGMIFYRSAPPEENIFWCTFLYIAPTFIPSLFIYFTHVFPSEDKKWIWLKSLIIFGLNAVVVFLVSVPGFIISAVNIRPGLEKQIVFTQYYWIYFLYIFCLFNYGFYRLINKYRASVGTERQKVLVVFLSYALAANVAFVTNLTMPWLGYFFLNWMGQVFSLAMVGFASYAILRYRFMDISFVVGRGFVYLATYLTILGTSFVVVAGHGVLGYNVPSNILWPILLVLGVWAFPYVFALYEGIAEKYFYYTYYTNQRALSELSRKLNKVLELDDLCQLISQAIMGTMKTSNVAIALKNEKGDLAIIENAGFGKNELGSFLKNEFLKNYLDETLHALATDDIPSLIASRNSNEYEQRRLNDLREEMNKCKIEICLPLAIEDKLSGVIVLGEKANNEQFLDQDIEMLTALANHSSLALQNAQFYSEIKQFGHKLEATVAAKSDQLREANTRLEQLDNAKSEFISIASHQLRSPLTVIKGYLAVTMDGDYGQVPPNVLSSLQTAYNANEQLIGFTNDLLDMSRLESGKIEIKPDLTDLATSINIVIDKLSSEAKKIGTELKFLEPAEKMELIKVDKERIEQAIYNIVANAITHTPRGKITIGLEKISKGQRIVIADTGEGVSREDLKNIFNKQPPAGKEPANSNIVSGMGLYLAKKMVEMNHGKIKAESKGLGQGSVVIIELPSDTNPNVKIQMSNQ